MSQESVSDRYELQLQREVEDLDKQIAALQSTAAETQREIDGLQAKRNETQVLLDHVKGAP